MANMKNFARPTIDYKHSKPLEKHIPLARTYAKAHRENRAEFQWKIDMRFAVAIIDCV